MVHESTDHQDMIKGIASQQSPPKSVHERIKILLVSRPHPFWWCQRLGTPVDCFIIKKKTADQARQPILLLCLNKSLTDVNTEFLLLFLVSGAQT